MDETKKILNRVLQEDVMRALRQARQLMGDNVIDMLEQYRVEQDANYRALIAANGITKSSDQLTYPARTMKFTPECSGVLGRLDEIFSKIHRHRSYPADFVDASLAKEINVLYAKRPRKSNKKDEQDSIISYLLQHGYEDSELKKVIISDAAERFVCSESKIQRAAKVGGLIKIKKPSVI